MLTFLCYPRCTTCQKAQKWLDQKGLEYERRDIKTQNPSETELAEWIAKSDLPVRRFFNTSGNEYRGLSLSSRIDSMTDNEKIKLLASSGMLVKRPILLAGDKVLVGFREEEWKTIF